MELVSELQQLLHAGLVSILGSEVDAAGVVVQPTRNEFEGDYTLVVFPWAKQARKSPEALAAELGEWAQQHSEWIAGYNVVRGFLNLALTDACWAEAIRAADATDGFGLPTPGSSGTTVMVEYSSPNTNKPLHLGHIRNILLGHSVSQLLKAAGHTVVQANLVNDRGVHICKSMLAWQRFGEGETPQTSGLKGDHLIGKYYVRFDQEYRREVAELMASRGISEEEAKAQAPILLAAHEMLRAWEAHDPEVVALWERMNGWVYEGFDATYARLGVAFDKVYYESQTYLLGKKIVMDGLSRGILFQKDDGSIWCDLTADGLDQKLLLRSDGTSVYMTQDLGTAVQRAEAYHLDSMVYVVGNEQDYHFQVLRLILKKLGYTWAERLHHLSYGMVFLPSGKMKSREGTVVDADDLIDSLDSIARQTAESLGKQQAISPDEADEVYHQVGLGALKYFMLKVDPTKNMTFNPEESIEFNGNTGPFIQYTHARACSVLRQVEDPGAAKGPVALSRHERTVARRVCDYTAVVLAAAEQFSPALVANYAYELAREFNQFYHECPIARESDVQLRGLRIALTRCTAAVLKSALGLLGIWAPERM